MDNGIEQKQLSLKINIPKSISFFINWYCQLTNIKHEEFVYSMILHSMTDLMNEIQYEEKMKVFLNLGVL